MTRFSNPPTMIIQISASETRTAYGVFSCHHPVHEGAPAATSGSIVDDTRHLQDLTIRGPHNPVGSVAISSRLSLSTIIPNAVFSGRGEKRTATERTYIHNTSPGSANPTWRKVRSQWWFFFLFQAKERGVSTTIQPSRPVARHQNLPDPCLRCRLHSSAQLG